MEDRLEKVVLAAALAAALFTCFAPVAQAAPVPARIETGAPANITEIAVNCGRHSRYVRGHRDRRTHRFIRGHCVRNRR